MKQLSFLVPVLLLTASVSCRKPEARLPNIILIVADDLGWKEVGFMSTKGYSS